MSIPSTLFRLLMGQRLPTIHGHLNVSSIDQTVEIRRDRFGIPHIRAHSAKDAWYGLGFCQGQDRAYQLEQLLRIVRGKLSELFGPKTLSIDRLSRRVGFSRTAQLQLQQLEQRPRRMLEAFAQGLTAGASKGTSRKAHEFSLLRTSPSPYQASDVLGILKLMSFLLPSNWDTELARLQILRNDGPQALKDLEPVYPDWLPSASGAEILSDKTLDRLAEDINLLSAATGYGGGSNNWVVGKDRTATGRPMLANDPHLAPVLPPHWYLSHIQTDNWAAAGASLAGTPGYPVGFNGYLAWGITAGLLDNTDLFIEKLGPNGQTVQENNRFVSCSMRQEIIKVKKHSPVVENVLITPRGPIVGPALDNEFGALSLKATWLEPQPFKGFLEVHRAQTTDEFQEAFRRWPFLPLNLVFADTKGTIGWRLVGTAPRRNKGWGTIPQPGWQPQTGWKDQPVAFEDMPHQVNPSKGFLATANNRPTAHIQEPFLGIDWIDGYRSARILEVLGSDALWSIEKMCTLQTDLTSLPWHEMRKTVLSVPVRSRKVQKGLELLRSWDGQVTPHSAPAAVFEALVGELCQRLVKARAPKAARWALGKGFPPLVAHSVFALRRVGHLVRLLRKQPSHWFDRPWPEEIADALAQVMRRFYRNYGPSPQHWRWGRLRTLTLEHTLGQKKPLNHIFNRGPFPWGGDSHTVAQASVLPTNFTANPLFIPSLRMVVDVGNWDNNRFSLPGGQSGNPLSPCYDNLLGFWKNGTGVPMAWSPSAVRQTTKHTLCLLPC